MRVIVIAPISRRLTINKEEDNIMAKLTIIDGLRTVVIIFRVLVISLIIAEIATTTQK